MFLHHPSILRVFGYSFIDNKFAIVTEVASTPLMTPDSASRHSISLALDICHGLLFLHSNNFIHGALRPSNILIVDGHARLSDFKFTDSFISSDAPAVADGRLKYAAPEVFNSSSDSESSTFQSDVYSLGVVIYELLTNRTAFDGYSTRQLFIATNKASLLTFPDENTEFKDLVSRCLRTDPLTRPNITEIIEFLKRFKSEFDKDDVPTTDEVYTLKSQNAKFIKQIEELKAELKRIRSAPSLPTEPTSSVKDPLVDIKKTHLISSSCPLPEVSADTSCKIQRAIIDIRNGASEIRLPNDDVTDEGVVLLSEEIKKSTSLKVLVLGCFHKSSNTISKTGAEALRNALLENRSITAINLNCNNLGSQGAIALVKALTVDSPITSLELTSNNIGSRAIDQLVDCLNHNPQLLKLDLRKNQADPNRMTQYSARYGRRLLI
ncbi:hypothetical protein GEMRC1_004325 [Eukaryota sp. GEM-RC1]